MKQEVVNQLLNMAKEAFVGKGDDLKSKLYPTEPPE